MTYMRKALRNIIDYLREVFGEKAYARYCDYVRSRGGQPMAAEEFYRLQLEAKYSRPNRCC
ncbi:MAG TPA: YbdD/YjiX family protein [Terriglobia bacterium]|nr:YbdD/YjiX family protein [Terriglobia bacterium]